MRLSPFGARIRMRGNRTIEEIYQGTKVFEDGATGLLPLAAKAHQKAGYQAINIEVCARLYPALWDEYIAENPRLVGCLTAAGGLSDIFGKYHESCQATELWRIRCHALGIAPEFDRWTPARKGDAQPSLFSLLP